MNRTNSNLDNFLDVMVHTNLEKKKKSEKFLIPGQGQ